MQPIAVVGSSPQPYLTSFSGQPPPTPGLRSRRLLIARAAGAQVPRHSCTVACAAAAASLARADASSPAVRGHALPPTRVECRSSPALPMATTISHRSATPAPTACAPPRCAPGAPTKMLKLRRPSRSAVVGLPWPRVAAVRSCREAHEGHFQYSVFLV